MANKQVQEFMTELKRKNPGETKFHQAVEEVVETLMPVLDRNPQYRQAKVLERLVEPERVIMFRVPWLDDNGDVQVNKGFRVEFNSAIGPYKGGLRFHADVNLSTVKFLGFEQIFKNSLTTLPMGGGKGGSDFDPRGKSDLEVMRFCQAFMNELYRHIGPQTDIPSGDMGVGAREIGFLFGQYKKLRNTYDCAITGKGINWNGIRQRPEATGYGVIYFAEAMFNAKNDSLKGKTIAFSGAGNVARYAAEKALDLGGLPVTFSDTTGTLHDPDGFTVEKLAELVELKQDASKGLKAYSEKYAAAEFLEGQKPWQIKCNVAIPCATENEIGEADAQALLNNGCGCVCEGASMPTESAAIRLFRENNILFAPGKAANAGGSAISGLEMTEDNLRLSWHRDELDQQLQKTMKEIHQNCLETAERYGQPGDYVTGANIAGFLKVADSMMDLGVI